MRVHKPDLMTALCWIAVTGVLLSSWSQARAADGGNFVTQLDPVGADIFLAAGKGLGGAMGPLPIPLLTAGVSVTRTGGVMAQFGLFTQPNISMHASALDPSAQSDDVTRPKFFPAAAMVRLVKQF